LIDANTVEIRTAGRADIPLIADLHVRSWQDAYRGMLPEQFLQSTVPSELAGHWNQPANLGDILLVAKSQEGLVGFAATKLEPEPCIQNLHVLPMNRSAGVGRALLCEIAKRLHCKGKTTVHLWVIEQNQRAISFYVRNGGRVGRIESKSVFGFDIDMREISWPNLAKFAIT